MPQHPLVRPLERLGKWSFILAIVTVVMYVVCTGLARGDQAAVHALAAQSAKFLVATMALCVLCRLIAGGLRRR